MLNHPLRGVGVYMLILLANIESIFSVDSQVHAVCKFLNVFLYIFLLVQIYVLASGTHR